MTEKQQKQWAIQKAVSQVMEKNQSKWEGIAELKATCGLFMKNLKKMERYQAFLNIDLAPLKQRKNSSKQVLIKQVFPVAAVLGVYASDMKDKKLFSFVSKKSSDLEKMKAEGLEKFCLKILKISGALLDLKIETMTKPPSHVVADYGLRPVHLDDLKAALDINIRSESEFFRTKQDKKKSKQKLGRLVGENNQILKKKMDRMMHLFRDSQKSFYDAYIKARIVTEAEPPVPVAKKTAPASVKKTAPAVAKKTTPAAARKTTTTKKPVTRKAPATRKPPASKGGATK